MPKKRMSVFITLFIAIIPPLISIIKVVQLCLGKPRCFAQDSPAWVQHTESLDAAEPALVFCLAGTGWVAPVDVIKLVEIEIVHSIKYGICNAIDDINKHLTDG